MGSFITLHEIPTAHRAAFLSVMAEDFPSERDGTYARYTIRDETRKDGNIYGLLFQEGDPGERGVNGVTEEAVLAVLLDRLADRQNHGVDACPNNQKALEHLRFAMKCLHHAKKNEGRKVDREDIRYPVNNGRDPTTLEVLVPTMAEADQALLTAQQQELLEPARSPDQERLRVTEP